MFSYNFNWGLQSCPGHYYVQYSIKVYVPDHFIALHELDPNSKDFPLGPRLGPGINKEPSLEATATGTGSIQAKRFI